MANLIDEAGKQKPYEIVLNAYAQAYPTPLNLTITANRNVNIKYFPANWLNEGIAENFINTSLTEIATFREDVNVMAYTNAFTEKGYFIEDELQQYGVVKRSADLKTITIDFEKIVMLQSAELKENMIQQVLTVIYGKRFNDSIYFFNPHGHILKAASLKETVDIMIRSRDAARVAE